MDNFFSDNELHLQDATEQEKLNMCFLRENILNPLRKEKGEIVCTSGHRNKTHNQLVGGDPHSHHLCISGYAAVDFKPKRCTLEDAFQYLKENFDYAELILEYDQGVTHVSINRLDKSKNIKRTSRRKLVKGKKTY